MINSPAKSSHATPKSTMSRLTHLVGSSKHHLYKFHQGSAEDTNLLGVKGANICEMVRMKLPVPPGFIISSETCIEYFQHPEKKTEITNQILGQCRKAVQKVEKLSGGMFHLENTSGNDEDPGKLPLLLAVRHSPSITMPGLMDSVLNLGINDKVVEVMAEVSNNPRWAYDTYRRFIQNYGVVVLGMDRQKYEDIMTKVKVEKGVEKDSCLDVEDLKRIVSEFKNIALFTQDPWEQLISTVEAVFYSWYAPRAVKYREMQGITHDLGTAIIIQAMVYGNLNDHSGTGVVVSRNPCTGQQEIWGEYFPSSLGPDIASGTCTPQALSDMKEEHALVYDAIIHVAGVLETRFKDVQDVQFTVQNGALYLLQTRNAKRTSQAAVHIAVSMVVEKRITEREALLRIDPQQMSFVLHPMIDPRFASGDPNDEKIRSRLLGKGYPSSPGVASGKIVFTTEDAEACRGRHEDCILVRMEASVDDFAGLKDATGAVTILGGLTAHASMLMRSINKPVVTGVTGLKLDTAKQELSNDDGSHVLHAGDVITVDGSSGAVYLDAIPFIVAGQDEYFKTVLSWADKYKQLCVQAVVASRYELKKAKEVGAEGVGLLKTEHMFFHKDYVELFQQVILSTDEDKRQAPLEKLLELHTTDFVNMFRCMDGADCVKIRLLNRGFSVFLPDPQYAHTEHYQRDVKQIAERCGLSYEECHEAILSHQEINPEHGLRGSRLSVIYPDIFKMQIMAIAQGILEAKKQNIAVTPSIVIPQKYSKIESDLLVPLIRSVCLSVCQDARFTVKFLNLTLGVMIEVPDGVAGVGQAVVGHGIDFVGFDTNDLTELMFGISKKDSAKVMPAYIQEHHIFAKDPFKELDLPSVGSMLQKAVMSCREGPAVRGGPATQVTVYGDHCSDKNSLRFLSHIGVDCVCVDPLLVPIAKIAAAQGKILDDLHGKKHASQMGDFLQGFTQRAGIN